VAARTALRIVVTVGCRDVFYDQCTTAIRASVEGVLAYFTHLKCQKRIGDDVGDFKYIFTKNKNKKIL
jgi:hypothetical protein